MLYITIFGVINGNNQKDFMQSLSKLKTTKGSISLWKFLNFRKLLMLSIFRSNELVV